MSASTVTARNVGVVEYLPHKIIPMRAAAAITRGQAIYQTALGKGDLADANGSGTIQFRGIALDTKAAGEIFNLLIEGPMEGADLSALDFDAPVYLSNTAGGLDTAAGGTTVIVGRVMALTEGAAGKKVLYVQADWLHVWA